MKTETMTLSKRCPLCGKFHEVKVEIDPYLQGLEKYRNGAHVQDAFPTFTPAQCEFIATGICETCWKDM